MPDTTSRHTERRTVRATLRVGLLAAACASPAAAQYSAEALSASAAVRFLAAVSPSGAANFRPTLSAGAPRGASAADDFGRDLRDTATLPRPVAFPPAMNRKVAGIRLASLLNRHLKTSLRYQIAGRDVWFSGAYDGGRNDYLSILVDGFAPMYFDVKSLLDGDKHFRLGSATFTLSVSPNIIHKMKSAVVLTADQGSREVARFTVQEMVDAVSAAGLPLVFSDQTYKFYYADGAGDGRRLFVFFHCDGKNFHVDGGSRPFLIPESQVTGEGLVVPLFDGKPVGLAIRDGAVQIYEAP